MGICRYGEGHLGTDPQGRLGLIVLTSEDWLETLMRYPRKEFSRTDRHRGAIEQGGSNIWVSGEVRTQELTVSYKQTLLS